MNSYNPFTLPFTITFEEQLQLINSAKNIDPVNFKIEMEDGSTLSRNKANTKVITESYRKITNDSTEYGLPATAKHKDFCLNRFNTNIKWEWKNNESARLVKKLLAPLEDVIQLTRVFALIRKPGEPALTHTDVAYNHSYPYGWESKPHLHGDSVEHHKNNYAAIRIPLTEQDGNNGLPYLYLNDQPYYYDAGKNFFVLDEIRNPHGADPVDFYRGVVFVDGFVNFEKLEKLKSDELVMTERAVHDWDGDMSKNFDIVFS
jgi:hypothetical protein